MDTFEEESMLVRKLTRRHQFKATVKYIHEQPQGLSSNNQGMGNISGASYSHPQEVSTFGQRSPRPDQDLFASVTSPPPERHVVNHIFDTLSNQYKTTHNTFLVRAAYHYVSLKQVA